MSSRAAGPGRFVGATTLAAALFLCTPGLLAAQENAGNPAGEAPLHVELSTDGTYASFQPVARVELNRPGYVALFEVEPEVGATMLYPDDPDDPRRYGAGVHELRLNGIALGLRRQLMAWHLGWAFAHRPQVVPENHLVAVVSDEPLDVSELRSERIFRHVRGSAGPGEVTDALLAAVVGRRPAVRWDVARTSYAKYRDPWLLATSGPWYDAPFLPLRRELVFTGWPPGGAGTFLFSCGPAFAVTGEYFVGRTAHDLNVCRHAVPDRRLLASLSWRDPEARARRAAGADASGTPASAASDAGETASRDASSTAEGREPLPQEVREALRRIADATERARSGPDLRSVRHLESVGAAMRARGIGVDAGRLQDLRWKAETRTRLLQRMGASAERARRLGASGRAFDLGDARTGDRGSGVRRNGGGARPFAGSAGSSSRRPSTDRIRRRAPDPPRPSADRPGNGTREPREDAGGNGSGGNGG